MKFSSFISRFSCPPPPFAGSDDEKLNYGVVTLKEASKNKTDYWGSAVEASQKPKIVYEAAGDRAKPSAPETVLLAIA